MYLRLGIFLSFFFIGCSGLHWDYLVFTQRWPVSFCSYTVCTPLPKPVDFVVHGLWPSLGDGDSPSHCNAAPAFDRDRLKPLLPELRREWPNLLPDTTADNFWKHEWDKHGKCASEDSLMANELQYFNVSLGLRRSSSVLKQLHDHGIIPSNDTLHQRDDVINALLSAYNVRPTINCIKIHGATARLNEIHLCYSPSLRLIDCPVKSSCPVDSCSLGDVNRQSPVECPQSLIFPSPTNSR
ncbi:unnamed protein product [Calicophoron daubneyi]|uniref:Uncharacterized protein n=1 Tax=Calicophoron daubneyi TaxID=300641 RepID=A0AAV2T931_CALDB